MTDLEADLKIAQARIKELEAQIPKWISVEDRLPETFDRVLVFNEYDGINISWLQPDGKRFSVKTAYPDRPTHWMPLPEAPKEG